LAGERSLAVDVGVVEYYKLGKPMQRYFINTAGTGFDAAVIAVTEKSSSASAVLFPIYFGVLRTILTYRNKQVTYKVGDTTETKLIVSIMVANGRYAGGGMKFAPTAKAG